MAQNVTQLPNGRQQFFDDDGLPLGLGTVTMYVPLTTTFKDTWSDAAQGALNTNPIVLDLAGEAVIWGIGLYRQIVKDVLGNTIWDEEVLGLLSSGGTWTPITADPNPAVAGTNYLCNTSGGAFNVTLPIAPSVGDTIGFADMAGTFASTNLTVLRNGKLIMGLAENMTVSTTNAFFRLSFSGNTYGWRLVE